MADRKEYTKQWYENRKINGLCIVCENGVAVKDRTLCPICLEKNRTKRSREIKEKKENGICVNCASVAVDKKIMCQSCLDKEKIKTKKRLQIRKDNGICVRCSNNAISGYIHCQKCRDKAKLLSRKRKQIVLDHYGQKCNCKCGCSVTRINHLTIDHINNNGHLHRAQVGFSIYRWIIKNNFPDDLQVLCWNCNCAKQQYGGCSDDDMTATRTLKMKKNGSTYPELTLTNPNFK